MAFLRVARPSKRKAILQPSTGYKYLSDRLGLQGVLYQDRVALILAAAALDSLDAESMRPLFPTRQARPGMS